MQAADILSITLSQLATNPRRMQHNAPAQYYPYHSYGTGEFPGFNERSDAAFTLGSPVGGSSAGTTPTSTPLSSDSKRYKKVRNKELLRCKRRLDFNNNSGRSVPTKPLTPAVQRRNERERNRVRLINMTFATLRQHLPGSSNNGSSSPATVNNGGGGHNLQRKQKMSKVDTLKSAIDYIKYMQELLDENDAVDAAFRAGTVVPVQTTAYQRPAMLPLSPTSMSVSSPGSESASDTDNFLADEDDLLDFSSWFN
ncbi:achaete-scute homolog 1a-like [Tubulanus polymorphus]|uniref:achaete-scute homolog 1a-like n=1 Tax=Tubulanus polymorphus TaxID=672921 RepID=UPI003DA3023A